MLGRRDEKGATEGVTDEQMKERGVTTAVEAVQMAPGLSVEDGKNVYVRGLGDRYTKNNSKWNGNSRTGSRQKLCSNGYLSS